MILTHPTDLQNHRRRPEVTRSDATSPCIAMHTASLRKGACYGRSPVFNSSDRHPIETEAPLQPGRGEQIAPAGEPNREGHRHGPRGRDVVASEARNTATDARAHEHRAAARDEA